MTTDDRFSMIELDLPRPAAPVAVPIATVRQSIPVVRATPAASSFCEWTTERAAALPPMPATQERSCVMLTLIKRPGAPCARYDLTDNPRIQLAAMQEICGGYIEIAVRGRDFVVWCDEEGKLKRPSAPINFYRVQDTDPIVGSVIVTSLQQTRDGMDCAPLSELTAVRVAKLLDAWSDAGLLVGTKAEHFDPFTDDEHAIANRVSLRRRQAATALLGVELDP